MYKFNNSLAVFALIVSAVCTGAIALAPSAVAQQFSEWSTPINLNGLPGQITPINGPFNDQHPGISKDGLSLYFSSDRPGGCGGSGDLDIWASQRDSLDSPWKQPFNLDAARIAAGLPCVINSSGRDLAPNLTPDGHFLFFHSFRSSDNCGGGDIYYAYRENPHDDLGWEPPRNLNRFGRDPNEPLVCGPIGSTDFVNTPNTDAGPSYFQDELTGATVLYFTRSDQPTTVGDFDIYTANLRRDGIWGTIVRDNELSSTPYRDTRTAIRHDGLEIFISSERPGGVGGDTRDLWVSTRSTTNDPWGIPLNLGPGINTSAFEGGPALSFDGKTLYFYSDRPGGSGKNDLYVSTRAEITHIDDPQFFVRQHYHDFLNREPDQPGLDFWTHEITDCGPDARCVEIKKINVSAAFFLSIEFQQTGFLVYRMYKAAYGDLQNARVPIKFNEFLPDAREVSHGVVVGQTGWEIVLENNKQAFSDEFVNRARFTSAYPQSMAPAEFVDKLNANAGNRLSQTERDHLVSDLEAGAKTRAGVLRAVAENEQLTQQEFNRAFVLMEYFGYLRRNPNDAPDSNFDGYNFWLNKLNSFNGNFVQAEMVKAFITSAEYRNRFGS